MCFDSQSICSCGCTATMTQNKRIIRLIVVWCDTIGILSAALALYRGVDWPGKRLHRCIDVMHHSWITVCCIPNSSRGPLHSPSLRDPSDAAACDKGHDAKASREIPQLVRGNSQDHVDARLGQQARSMLVCSEIHVCEAAFITCKPFYLRRTALQAFTSGTPLQ